MEYIANIVSSLAAIAAILAPLLTAHSNSKHNLEIKKIDAFYQYKFAIYQEFFEDYGVFIASNCLPNLVQTSKSISAAMLIASDETRLKLKQLLINLNTKQEDYMAICNKQFDECVILVCDELNIPSVRIKRYKINRCVGFQKGIQILNNCAIIHCKF